MSRVITRSLQKQIDQSENKSDIDTLRTIIIDRIIREIGFDSHANIVNTKERTILNEVAKQEIM
jgi:hypothetical protein